MIDVERSMPAPESLDQEVRYSDEDVLVALYEGFHRKCYLCERSLSLGEIEVDHRRPKARWPEGTFAWTNLFPACGYCNGRRPKGYPEAGLLAPGDGVEQRIRQRACPSSDGLELECEFAAVERADAAAATADELRRLHSSVDATTFRARVAARELLNTIHDHYIERVYPLEVKVRRARAQGRPDSMAESSLRTVLSRHAPFTMLMRSLVDLSLAELFD